MQRFGWALALVCFFEEHNQKQILEARIERLESYIEDNGLPTPAILYEQGMTLGPGESTTIKVTL